MDSLGSDIIQVTLLLLAGSAGRFLWPWIVLGLGAIERENSLRAWPKWEWKYVTSIIWAMIGYGIALVANPEGVANMLTLSPWTIIGLAYFGQDIVSRADKVRRQRRK